MFVYIYIYIYTHTQVYGFLKTDRMKIYSFPRRRYFVAIAFQLCLYAISRFRVNLDGLKLNGTHQLLVYVDVNILGKRVHTINKNSKML